MTKNPKTPKKAAAKTDKPRKLTKPEREEAFRLMNENFSQAMTILLSDLEKQKLESHQAKTS